MPESKIVGEVGKVGGAIQVKEGKKIHTGVLVDVGNRLKVENKLNDVENKKSLEQQGESLFCKPTIHCINFVNLYYVFTLDLLSTELPKPVDVGPIATDDGQENVKKQGMTCCIHGYILKFLSI